MNNEVFEENENVTTEEVVEETVVETTETDILAQAIMGERDMQKVTAKQRVMKILVQIGLYTFLGIMALIVLFPFYWMIISSLKTLDEYDVLHPCVCRLHLPMNI